MRTYNVALHKGVDYDQFWDEIENLSDTDGFVPSRRVDIVWERESSLRQCWYELSDEEADLLRQDPRVCCVEIPPEHRDDIEIGLNAVTTNQTWSKRSGTAIGGDHKQVNWGLQRTNARKNPFGTDFEGTADFPFSLDGTGVDVVIQDSGVQIDHPEFLDDSGVSRVQQINWFTESGVSGTMPPFSEFYNDTHGHGTHVAGIACGKHYGMAKNAQIFVQIVSGLNGPGTTGISSSQCFDTLKGWHLNKPIDPATGYKRPSIVNMSWGYYKYFPTNITGGQYQGELWSQSAGGKVSSKGMIGQSRSGSYIFGSRVDSVDIDLEECLDAGIIFCSAAGNTYQTVDVEDGVNFDNYYITSTSSTPVYYMRGGSPWSNDAIIVGNINYVVYSSSYNSLEQKSSSSESGPAVTIWAPGSNIISAVSLVNDFASYEISYGWDNDWGCMSISGTSMASPQVAGYCALIAQLYPHVTPATMKQYIIDNSTEDELYDTPDNPYNYTNTNILHGGPNRILYQSYQSIENGSISGDFEMSDVSISFGAKSFDNISDSPDQALATINSFTSNNYSLSGSGTVTLSWDISNATNASINYTSSTGSLIQTSVNPVSGSTGITVSNTTTFTLTATNSGGSVTRSLTVTVASGSSLAINYFTASPSSVTSGSPVNLSWSASGAVSATISSIGSVSPSGGNTTVYPYSSQSYTLTIYSSTGQSTSRSVYVNVSGIPLGEGDNP